MVVFDTHPNSERESGTIRTADDEFEGVDVDTSDSGPQRCKCQFQIGMARHLKRYLITSPGICSYRIAICDSKSR